MKPDYAIPEWIDEKFLVKVIKHNHQIQDREIVIKKFQVDFATSKGENYSSELFRVTYSCLIRNTDISNAKFLVKTGHSNPQAQVLFTACDFNRNEFNMYQKYLPEIHNILKEVGIEEKLSPKSLYFDPENDIIVMDDESANGYRIGNQDQRFSVEGIHMTLTKLAHFHAASAVYNQRHNGTLEKFKNKLFQEGPLSFVPVFDKMLEALTGQVSGWKGYEQYVPKIQKLQVNFQRLQNDAFKPIEGFNCLVHGDLWLNNILLRFQNNDTESNVLDILLIDWQLVSWSSPVIDLIYFFFTTLNEEHYQTRIDEFIYFYHEVLSNTLKKFDYKEIPSLLQLHTDFLQKLFHAVYGGILIKSILFMEANAKVNVENILNDNASDLLNKNAKNNRIQEEIKYIIKYLDRKGILDI